MDEVGDCVDGQEDWVLFVAGEGATGAVGDGFDHVFEVFGVDLEVGG